MKKLLLMVLLLFSCATIDIEMADEEDAKKMRTEYKNDFKFPV